MIACYADQKRSSFFGGVKRNAEACVCPHIACSQFGEDMPEERPLGPRRGPSQASSGTAFSVFRCIQKVRPWQNLPTRKVPPIPKEGFLAKSQFLESGLGPGRAGSKNVPLGG